MNRSLKLLCGHQDHIDLEQLFGNIDYPKDGLFKCRITYDESQREIEFVPYQYKPVSTLRIIEHDRISYEFKYADRCITHASSALIFLERENNNIWDSE
jgi:4-amino-4-deoxychorismate lyase